MPPTRVLMSTCFSSPFFSFFTLTLQASENSSAIAKHITTLVLPIARSSLCNLCRTLQAGASFRNIRNRHRQMPANWNLSKQGLDGCNFANAAIGRGAHVSFDLREIACQIRVPHCDHRCLSRPTVEQLLEKRSGCV